MLLIFSTPVLIRYLWQLKTVVFQHWCTIRAVLLKLCDIGFFNGNDRKCSYRMPFYSKTMIMKFEKFAL